MNDSQELLNTLILTRLSYFNLNAMVELYRHLGSATAIIEQRKELVATIPGMPQRVKEALTDVSSVKDRALEELEYCRKQGIEMLCLNDDDYPHRLKECPDAPLMLFYKGTADLNCRRVINIVGTRRCTPYGRDLVRKFVSGLHELCPDVLIVSGLAYGIDISAHRNALQMGMETVAVLAHGLDDLYPAAHRDTANEMLLHGGLLTEYMSHTQPDRLNFVRRNRITAGISDACIIVESAYKGGGLITARISREYHRDVFAFPGPVGAPYSEGCNNLIRDNGAALITSAADFLNAMGWQQDKQLLTARAEGIERQLFPNLTDDEQRIVSLLQKTNDLQQNIITVKTGLAAGTVSSLLFSLEMKGVLKPYAGGTYHLLG